MPSVCACFVLIYFHEISNHPLDDGVNCIRSLTRDGRFVPGGGATEIELASRLSSFADRCTGLEQYAVKKFAEALEVFPRTLATNAGLVDTDIISKLYAAHERGQSSMGVDIEVSHEGVHEVSIIFYSNQSQAENVGDMLNAKVLDVSVVKEQALRLATDTACTVLRIDQLIMAKPAGGPKMPQNQGHWDDDEE